MEKRAIRENVLKYRSASAIIVLQASEKIYIAEAIIAHKEKIMKKFHKAVTTVAVAALSAALCFSLAACGETQKAADLVASYNSSSYTFMTAFPDFTFKQLTSNVQNINVYDDNTYMLMVTTKSLSGDLKFDPSNTGDQVA